MTMTLTQIINENLPFKIPPNESWASYGDEATSLTTKFGLPITVMFDVSEDRLSILDGLLLLGALSSQAEPQSWLKQVITPLKINSVLLVIDWQDDGPLDQGPPLKNRFKKGQLRRLLHESGYGQVETLLHRPRYYMIKGIKGPALPIAHANEFVDVAGLDELPKNKMKVVTLFGHNLIIANTGREIVAFTQTCPHADAPFDQGLLRKCRVICPLHGYIWNVCTGEPENPPNEDILRRYQVRIKSKRILVALEAPL